MTSKDSGINNRLNPYQMKTDRLSHLINRIKKYSYSRVTEDSQKYFERKKFEKSLKLIQSNSTPCIEGNVLVDATFDNPNYWLRFSILSAALGLSSTNRIGVIGKFRRKKQTATLKRLGIDAIYDLADVKEFSAKNRKIAKQLVGEVKAEEEILSWHLPHQLPPELLYDCILKLQKHAFVRTNDDSFVPHACDFLNYIDSAGRIIQATKPDLIISSHAIGLHSPLVWIGLQNGVKIIVPFGNNGHSLYWMLSDTSDIFDFHDRMKPSEFLSITVQQNSSLEGVGYQAIMKRFNGEMDNFGVECAYKKAKAHVDREKICKAFNWDSNKKIIAVYASNWFDYPHTYGMKHFRNFYDWIVSIINKIKDQSGVNWLFKPHPCDDWYGGLTLSDLVDFSDYDHIKLASKEWNNKDMLRAIDGIITYHGTVGIEATCIEKPVLVSDQGWYDDLGFVKRPSDREDFLNLLGTKWWSDMDIKENARLARLFAGTYWGRPSWQKDFLLENDHRQWEIYKTSPELITKNKDIIEKEIRLIRRWFQSGHSHYHAYKMLQTDKYIV